MLSPGRPLIAPTLRDPGVGVTERRGGAAVAQPAPEPRLDRTRDRPPRARERRGREEGRRRGDGHQPAGAQLLPGEAPHRLSDYVARQRVRAHVTRPGSKAATADGTARVSSGVRPVRRLARAVCSSTGGRTPNLPGHFLPVVRLAAVHAASPSPWRRATRSSPTSPDPRRTSSRPSSSIQSEIFGRTDCAAALAAP